MPTPNHSTSINARRIAIDAIIRVIRDNLALELNPTHLATLPTRDRALAFEIATGTIRFLSLLDGILASCMERPPAKGRHFLWTVMRTALYQARWMRIPGRAAIHEAVEMIKTSPDQPRAGFVNALLRNAINVEPEVFLATITNPVSRLALAHAHPEWLVRRWWKQAGPSKTQQRLIAGNILAPLVLRANGLLTTPAELLASFGEHAVGCPQAPEGVMVSLSGNIETLPGYQAGLFAVQDGAAQWAARFVDPLPGEDILDVCAAPGGKTAHLAALAKGEARIWAVDRSAVRLQRLQETLIRLRIPNVEVITGDATDVNLLSGQTFHKVLADVPCTGTGVIRRHPDIKWRRTMVDPMKMAEAQQRILEVSAQRVVVGGLLVYAVCSLEPEESEEQIRLFLLNHPHWKRKPIDAQAYNLSPEVINAEGDFRTEPGWNNMDGFYIARLQRQN